MKTIAIYADGSAAVIDDESIHQISISGQEPIESVEATDENLKKYFGDIIVTKEKAIRLS